MPHVTCDNFATHRQLIWKNCLKCQKHLINCQSNVSPYAIDCNADRSRCSIYLCSMYRQWNPFCFGPISHSILLRRHDNVSPPVHCSVEHFSIKSPNRKTNKIVANKIKYVAIFCCVWNNLKFETNLRHFRDDSWAMGNVHRLEMWPIGWSHHRKWSLARPICYRMLDTPCNLCSPMTNAIHRWPTIWQIPIHCGTLCSHLRGSCTWADKNTDTNTVGSANLIAVRLNLPHLNTLATYLFPAWWCANPCTSA